MIRIVFFKSDDERFEIVKNIRTTVFINEQGANSNEEFDEYDSSGVFALLFEDEKSVGTARVVKTDKGYKIGRIAILKEYRGKGYGAFIVRAIAQKTFDLGTDEAFLNALNYAVPFYEKLGFEVIGEEIIERGLPHIQMSITRENFYDKKKK